MKKIDFSKLKMEVRIGEFEPVDVRKDLGNVLFSRANTLELDTLSRSIYNAPFDNIELNDGEYGQILHTLKHAVVPYALIQAIENGVKEVTEEKKKK
jgi:hypothetical protein